MTNTMNTLRQLVHKVITPEAAHERSLRAWDTRRNRDSRRFKIPEKRPAKVGPQDMDRRAYGVTPAVHTSMSDFTPTSEEQHANHKAAASLLDAHGWTIGSTPAVSDRDVRGYLASRLDQHGRTAALAALATHPDVKAETNKAETILSGVTPKLLAAAVDFGHKQDELFRNW